MVHSTANVEEDSSSSIGCLAEISLDESENSHLPSPTQLLFDPQSNSRPIRDNTQTRLNQLLDVGKYQLTQTDGVFTAQQRQQWTWIETERLVDLWEKYGNQWALIKSKDAEMTTPLLQARTNVNLKDKMRNYKIDKLR